MPVGIFIEELNGRGIGYLRRFLFSQVLIFIFSLIILLHSHNHHWFHVCGGLEEIGRLSESGQILSKTLLVPGTNHTQVFAS